MSDCTPSKRESSILLILFLGVLMGALDVAVIAPAFTRIQLAFGITERTLIWIFTIYVLFNLISTPIMARLADRWGRRRIYIISVALFALGSLIVAISWEFSVVIVGRAFQGIGSGGIFPIASTIIGDTFREERKGRALGYLGAVFGVAFIVGPVFGGLVSLISWHLIFVINLPVAAYVIVQARLLLPGVIKDQPHKGFDAKGMILLTVILGLFAWGLNQIDTSHFLKSITKIYVWPFLAVPSILFPTFLIYETYKVGPVIPVKLLRITTVAIGQFISLGAGVLTASLVLFPSLAMNAFNLNSVTASFTMIPAVLAASIGSLIIGRLVDRVGPKKVLLSGMILLFIGCVLLGITASTWVGFFFATFILALGFPALVGAPLRYIMLEEAPVEQRSAAQGMTATVISIGQLLGSAFLGALIASHGGGVHGYAELFNSLAIFIFILFVSAIFLKLPDKNKV